MVAAVAVETRQRAKRDKAAAEEETPPPPPPAAVRRPRQPTPDHPPYCWMIGEAIDALGEDGGSSEDAISTFIRGAHPGVPAAHDRFLRHYLAKHVAEGLFVRTAPGRYARCPDEPAAAAGSSDSEAARVEPPAKRRRGRPRKGDSSLSTPPAVKKGPGTTPKRRGRPRGAALVAVGDGSVPSSSVTAAGDDDEDGKQAKASKPRRRCRRLHKLATDVSDEAPITDIEDDGIDALPTTGEEHGQSLELALVVAGDDSTTTPTMDDIVCSEAAPTMPVDSDQSRELALVSTTEVPAQVSPMDKQEDNSEAEAEAASLNLALVVKQDAISGTSSAPEHNIQACELALMAPDRDPVPVLACELAVARLACKTDCSEAPSPRYRLRHPRKAPVIVTALCSALPPTSAAGKKARGKTLSATPKAKDNRRQDELALVPTGAQSAPVAIKLAPVTAGGGDGAPSVPPKLYPLTADEIPADPSWCLLALPAATNAC